jgi:hypothetical protein
MMATKAVSGRSRRRNPLVALLVAAFSALFLAFVTLTPRQYVKADATVPFSNGGWVIQGRGGHVIRREEEDDDDDDDDEWAMIQGLYYLMQRGWWDLAQAIKALDEHDFDVEEAERVLADAHEKDLELWGDEIEGLVKRGWDQINCLLVLRVMEGNVTAAAEALHEADVELYLNFERQVAAMMATAGKNMLHVMNNCSFCGKTLMPSLRG